MPLLFSLSGPPYRPIAIAGPCHAINLRHHATVSKFFRLDASSPAAVSFYTDGTEHYMRRYISRPSSLVSGFKTLFETIVANELFPSHQTLWSYGYLIHTGYMHTILSVYPFPRWTLGKKCRSIARIDPVPVHRIVHMAVLILKYMCRLHNKVNNIHSLQSGPCIQWEGGGGGGGAIAPVCTPPGYGPGWVRLNQLAAKRNNRFLFIAHHAGHAWYVTIAH